jgi:hypothetical protein
MNKVMTATIANGASLSNSLDMQYQPVRRIVMPSAWTAASLTFQVSHDGTTFYNLYDTSGEVTLSTTAANRAIGLTVTVTGWRYVKVRSGTADTPVNQAAERVFTVIGGYV